MLSLILGFFVASSLFRDSIRGSIEENLIASGKRMIQIYQGAPTADLVPFMTIVSDIAGSRIQIYNSAGEPMVQGEELPVRLEPDAVRRVLAGGIERNPDVRNLRFPLVGMPFQSNGERYALFLMPESNDMEHEVLRILLLVLALVLAIGSLLILLASRYIVKPLRLLTEATRRLARGTFDVIPRTRRKDELGQLTVSFGEMAQELAKVDRMRQDFVSSVSHEIQSPLTSIAGFARALKEKTMSEESRRRYLTVIGEESERLSRLSQNLLRLSSLQQGDLPLETGSFRLDEQLRRCIIALEPQWAAKRIEPDVALEEIMLRADEDGLYQVWINLLSNAIKFAPAGGVVRLEAAVTAGGEARVSVADSGPGIPAEERLDIFKPFHKVDRSRDAAVQGNGLGLAIVKRIVEMHRGDIAVSERVGGGTVLTVRLPLDVTGADDDGE